MATQEVALRNDQQLALRRDNTELAEVQRLGNMLAASGYFSDVRDMAQAAVKVLAGKELGLPPIASMMGINIIKGKVAMGSHLIASRIRAHGYDFTIKQLDKTGCVLEFLSKPDANGNRKALGLSSFNEQDAKDAQCFGDMYKKYPRNMYYARAVSNGAKWYTPEVLSGMPVYVPEELGAKVDENGDVIHEPATAAQVVADRKIAEMKAGKSYAEVSAPEPEPTAPVEEQAAAQIKARLEQFKRMRQAIGDKTYYRILGASGYEHANEIKSLSEARAIFHEMQQAHKDAALEITDADVPEGR